MFIAILGRQPTLGAAELERLYGSDCTRWFSDHTMLVESDAFDFNRLGGSLKAGRVILQMNGNWQTISRTIVDHYAKQWYDIPHKITLGISAYGFRISPRDIQKTGLLLKKQLQRRSISLRLIPNAEPALNTAASHHNKLGLSPHKVELLIVRNASGRVIIAESIGAQNISALAARDQARPRTDAFVGMLPPKLARMMVNFTGLPGKFNDSAAESTSRLCILDPFCGTGTVLQEALLSGYSIIGTDLSQKMIDYTTENLSWLRQKFRTTGEVIALQQADATTFQWRPSRAIDAVVCETYLGQPFSAPPRPEKLREVAG
ncbi:methyltransferase domain-containing protein, partial [TM7 phylum sp. oral taxon 349]